MNKIKVDYKRLDLKQYVEKYYDWEKYNGFCKQCPNYGKIWSCSPYDFDTEDYIKGYKYIYIIGTKIDLDKNLIKNVTNKDEVTKLTYEILNRVRKSQEANLLELEKKYPNSKSLYAGSCILCEKCARLDNKPCRNKDKMRYSLESLGFDVSNTISDVLGIKLIWANDRLPEYFTLVSGFLTNEENVDLTNF